MILVGKADDKQFRSMTGSRVIHKVLDNEGVYRSKTRIRSRRFSFEWELEHVEDFHKESMKVGVSL